MESNVGMEQGMYELVEKILWATSFIAIGGTVALMFFLIFAQSIFGSKTTHSQIDRLLSQTQQMNEQLRQIVQHLKKEGENPGEEKDEGTIDEGRSNEKTTEGRIDYDRPTDGNQRRDIDGD